MRLFDRTLTTLQRALDVRLERQGVLAGNLANANTPGFVPRDVDVAAALAQPTLPPALPAHTPGPGFIPLSGEMAPLLPAPLAQPAASLPALPGAPGAGSPLAAAQPGLDGNAVDLDRTMVALAQNALQYGASARAAQKKLAILRYVASDGTGG